MFRHKIILLTRKRKLAVSKDVKKIYRDVASFLNNMERDFVSGRLKTEDVEMANKTHFGVNVDNKKIGIQRDKKVKHFEATSGMRE